MNVLLSWTIIIQNNPVSLCSRLIAAFRQSVQPSLEALIAIANALEVPVQELVRQEEFNQEKQIE